MRDLELRGAGNLLGDEQSGHVAALGFELYMQMLDEAVRELDPDEDGAEPPEPVRLDVNVDAYVPADYIPYEQAKVDVHRRIAGAREISELMELRDELEDRFGEIPEPLENLITLQQARIKLGRAGATAVSFRGGRLAVTPIDLDAATARRLREVLPGANYEAGRSQLSLRSARRPGSALPRGGPSGRRAAIRPAGCLKVESRDRAYPETAATMRSREKVNFACAGRFAPAPYVQRPLLSATNDQGCSHRTQPRRRQPASGPPLPPVAACPATAVATVDGEAIEKQEFSHWMTVAAKSSGAAERGCAGSRGRLRQVRGGQAQGHPGAGQGPAEGDRRRSSRLSARPEYEQLRNQVLQLLISFKWIQGEADAMDVKVTDAEVKKSFDEQKKQSFPKDADYKKFIQQSGQTRGGHPPARQARPPVEQDPRQGRQGQGQRLRQGDRGLLQQEQGPFRPAGEA